MKKCIIIAEAGVNHNGSLEMALQLVKAAADAGADYVKFQTFRAASLVSKNAEKAKYQKNNCKDEELTQLGMLKKLELSETDFVIISEECRRQHIGFLSTPFDEESVDILSRIGMDYWKIPSGEITNLPLLRKIGAMRGKVILSTGMCTLVDVEAAVNALGISGTSRRNITLLHCTTQYPAPYSSVNLRAMDALRSLGCGGVGYSDHTDGITVPIAAVALGANIIEKHFTLNRNLPGPDHKASLESDELTKMVRGIRNVELALGDGRKEISDAESDNVAVTRKSIVASRAIKEGEILTERNLTCKRPGTGLSPMLWDKVTGTKAIKDFAPDEQIIL